MYCMKKWMFALIVNLLGLWVALWLMRGMMNELSIIATVVILFSIFPLQYGLKLHESTIST